MNSLGVDAAAHNCLQYHANTIVSNVEDERDFLRIWRRRWRDVIHGENVRLFRFLQAGSACADEDFMAHICEIPPNSDWFRRHVDVVFDLSGVLAELDTRLSVPYNSLRQANHVAQDRYAAVLERLFVLEDALNKKLELIQSIEKHLDSLTIVDLSGNEAYALRVAITDYIRGVYREHSINEAYKEFVQCYAEWFALRGVVLGSHFARSETTPGPICSICTVDKINCTLVPCGHTFCNNCTHKQRSLCYICRAPIRERMRIYFL
jgi:hypothetical protein